MMVIIKTHSRVALKSVIRQDSIIDQNVIGRSSRRAKIFKATGYQQNTDFPSVTVEKMLALNFADSASKYVIESSTTKESFR